MKLKMLLCLLIFSLLLSIVLAFDEYPVEKPSIVSGREIFNSNCAACHGEKGDGSALKGAFSFTDGELMIMKNSSVFFNAVTNGVPGTAMPPFGRLSISQRWDVVAYLWIFWADKAEVVSGKSIYQKNCVSCHGANGDGSGFTGIIDFTNLSMMVQQEPEVFFRSVSDGVTGTAMAPWKDSLSENQRWDSVKYIWTFQFNDAVPTPVKTPSGEIPPSGEPWFYTPIGMGIVVNSIAPLKRCASKWEWNLNESIDNLRFGLRQYRANSPGNRQCHWK